MIRSLALVLCLLLGNVVAGSPAAADEISSAVSTFKKSLKAEVWRDRVEAYTALTFYDSDKIVRPIMDAILKETHPAVQLSALKLLGKLSSEEARNALLQLATKEKGDRRAYALIAIGEQPAKFGVKELVALLAHKEGQVAGLAAQALGRKQAQEAVAPLTKLLTHSEWQVRAAAARALISMAGPKPRILVDENGVKSEEKVPWIPTWLDIKPILPVLADAFAKRTGPDRLAFLDCMERLTRKEFGWAPTAWRLLAAGTDEEQIKVREKHPQYLFGIPITGERVVVVLDHSLPTDDPHPFDPERLKELTQVPGGRAMPWFKIKRNKQFIAAHLKRWINELPKTTKFEIIRLAVDVNPVFGKFTAPNTGSKKKAIEAIEEVKLINGHDALNGLTVALDMGGDKLAKAWKKGPDTVVYISCGVPWEAKVTEQEHIAAAIGLKAEARLVPIHTIGVGAHPYDMLRVISTRSGGRYLDLNK